MLLLPIFCSICLIYFFPSIFAVQPTVPALVSPGAVGTETSVDSKNEEIQKQKDNFQTEKKQSLHTSGGYNILQHLFWFFGIAFNPVCISIHVQDHMRWHCSPFNTLEWISSALQSWLPPVHQFFLSLVPLCWREVFCLQFSVILLCCQAPEPNCKVNSMAMKHFSFWHKSESASTLLGIHICFVIQCCLSRIFLPALAGLRLSPLQSFQNSFLYIIPDAYLLLVLALLQLDRNPPPELLDLASCWLQLRSQDLLSEDLTE